MKFDARVLGVPNHLADARKYLSRRDFNLESAKFRAAEARLIEKLPDERLDIQEFFKRRRNCLGHFRCERLGFLEPLRLFACFVDGTTPEEVIQENAWTASLHIVLMGNADSLIVPFDFPVPIEAGVEGRPHPYVVCSGTRIIKELDALDEYVAVEETMGIRRFDAFVDLSRRDMERFEQKEGVGRRFWAKWGVMAMRGLVDRAMEARVPVIVDPQFGEVPAAG